MDFIKGMMNHSKETSTESHANLTPERQLSSKLNTEDENGTKKPLSQSEHSDESCTASDDGFQGNTSQPLDDSYIHKQLSLSSDGKVRKISATNLAKYHQQHSIDRFKRRLSSIHEPRNESKVLIIYTGGTIGMRCKDGFYSPEPNFLPQAIRELPPLNDHEYVDQHYGDVSVKPYCLPPVRGVKNRIVYWMVEYDPLLDSSDMTFDDWIRISNDLKKAYVNYDGFVILHGTDTLAYTACALSFMMENLGKPVILTGSQIPVPEVRSDGRENLIGALISAGSLDIPEVCVYFNNKLLRGNRTIKVDNSSMEAFISPNLAPLATMEIQIKVNYESIFRSNEIAPFTVHDNLCRNVGVLRIFPSIPIESVRAVLRPPTQGVVLETYGSGNIPVRRTDIIEEIRAAVQRGCLILNVSQCMKGHVTADYITAKALADSGAIPGSDMTVVAALTKLAYVLGKDCSLENKKLMLQQNLRGELTISNPERLNELDIIPRLSKFLHITSSRESRLLKEALFPPLVSAAAKQNDIALLSSLQLSGANLANTDYSGKTALHVAALHGNLESVNFLLQRGVSVHVRDSEGNALEAAIKSKNLDVITSLRKAGAHLSAPAVRIGTELSLAASQEDIQTLQAWKAAGASINQSDYGGRTALHIAVERGLEEVVEWLCDNGADPYAVDNFGRTPCDEAVSSSDRIRIAIDKVCKRMNPEPKSPKFGL